MRQYNYLNAFYLSFYSAPLYRDVARQWPGTGFLYILLLLALAWIPEMLHIHDGISRAIETEGRALADQVPAITITRGQVSTDVETPHFIRDPKTDKLLAVIDLTGEYTSLRDTEAEVLLTQGEIFMRRRRGSVDEIRNFNLSEVQHFAITRDDVARWLDIAKTWTAVVLYPFVLLFSFIYRILQVLLYALIGLLIAGSLKVALTYGTLLRLTAVAVTPVIILDTLRSVASVRVPALWLVAFAIAMGYLIFAIKANTVPADTEPQPPTPEPIS